jgi:hypothetical protein
MNTKLTLRLDEDLVVGAKAEARKRGSSVSRMVADYFRGITAGRKKPGADLPPLTSKLLGALHGATPADYRRHLEEKHL